jgi:hypothetical protein
MSNKQQTAVDWLYSNLKSHFEHDGDLLEVVKMSFEQAKELEKEQIKDACQQGFYDGLDLAKIKKSKFKSSEQYYNETYNQ